MVAPLIAFVARGLVSSVVKGLAPGGKTGSDLKGLHDLMKHQIQRADIVSVGALEVAESMGKKMEEAMQEAMPAQRSLKESTIRSRQRRGVASRAVLIESSSLFHSMFHKIRKTKTGYRVVIRFKGLDEKTEIQRDQLAQIMHWGNKRNSVLPRPFMNLDHSFYQRHGGKLIEQKLRKPQRKLDARKAVTARGLFGASQFAAAFARGAIEIATGGHVGR